VPKGKVKEVAAMLKAIHAQKDKKEALRKSALVIKKLQSVRLSRASDIVKDGISETVSYYAFPGEHWENQTE
jgi:putative transposase